MIIRESERLSGLVEELLDFSRLQSGRLRLMVLKIDILAELDEAVYMFTDRARTEHKQLNYEENTVLSPVYGDVDRLRQVFACGQFAIPEGDFLAAGRIGNRIIINSV